MFNRKLIRIIIPGLIVLILWSQAGSVLVHVCQSFHYHKMRTAGARNPFRNTIHISSHSAKQICWVKKDEIVYNGRMFDVKRVIAQDGNILFVGHYDKKDDNLISALTSFFDPTRHSQKSHHVNFVFFMLEAVIPACYEKINVVFDDDQIPPFGFYSWFYDFDSNEKTFQPPERS